MSSRFFLVTINIHGTTALSNTCRKVTNFLQDHGSAAKLIHRFKITGEPKLIAVFEVFNITGLERNLNAMSTIGVNDITCVPVLPFELFASSIGIQDPSLSDPSSHQISDKELYWIECSMEHAGLPQDDLYTIWQHEVMNIIKKRSENTHYQVDLFKTVGEKRTHMFVSVPSTLDLETLTNSLKVMQQNVANVSVKVKHIQQLDDYNSRINTEQLN